MSRDETVALRRSRDVMAVTGSPRREAAKIPEREGEGGREGGRESERERERERERARRLGCGKFPLYRSWHAQL